MVTIKKSRFQPHKIWTKRLPTHMHEYMHTHALHDDDDDDDDDDADDDDGDDDDDE